MRVVILAPSAYSETACAMAVRLAELGHVPAGALSLPALNKNAFLRKLAQWGVRDVARYARTKLIPLDSMVSVQSYNPHLLPFLRHGEQTFRSLKQVAKFYGFEVAICFDQNDSSSIARLQEWKPDIMVFTGGNILRQPVLDVPRFGVLNVHLGLLPEIKGMSSPEWSLLRNVPVGITIHFMDPGIDTGPILQRNEFADAAQCESLDDLRNRLISLGVEKIGDVITGLDRGTIHATRQSDTGSERQFFVMHDWLRSHAADVLRRQLRTGTTDT